MHRRRHSPAPGSRPPVAGHAVVVGAGVAGLAAAQALARHVERVTVIERDDLPERPGPRPGVPCGGHVHLLQPGGLAALERLLPGCGAELRAAGATAVRLPTDVLWLSPAGWFPRLPAADRHVALSASRELAEWTIRRRVIESPQVLVRAGLDVCGLVVRDGRVVGVEVRSRRAGTEGPAATIAADLVVDASGRRSPAPAWLAAAGAAVPDETASGAGLVSASRVLRRRPGDTPGWKAALLQGRPPASPRAGVLAPLERDRWLLTLIGGSSTAPPDGELRFAAHARSLRSPEIADLLDRAEPLGPITGRRHEGNRRRHYEHLVHPLDGFVAVGDALVALDPVCVQGLGVAALAAEALDRCLDDHLATHDDLSGVSFGAQRAVARATEGAWTLATRPDRGTTTARSAGGTATGRPGRVRRAADRARDRYADRVTAAACRDPVVLAAYLDVVGLVRPPATLLRPRVVGRALARRRPVRTSVSAGRNDGGGRGAASEAAMAPG
jgi:2-polyprenyl-6-methoxyphenol hydroxylase-like FAD-dependent oxidoreductase